MGPVGPHELDLRVTAHQCFIPVLALDATMLHPCIYRLHLYVTDTVCMHLMNTQQPLSRVSSGKFEQNHAK